MHLIDTAPSMNVILYNCLIAADKVIIPVTADSYALQGLLQLHDTIKAVQRRQNPNISIAGLLLIKYAGRAKLEKEMQEYLQNLASTMETKMFKTAIRECVKTKEAQANKKLIMDYAPKCTTSVDYQAFVKELLKDK